MANNTSKWLSLRHSEIVLWCLAILSALSVPDGEVSAQAWSFVSSPDIFNSDVGDLSGGTVSGINNAFPDPNAYAAAMSGLTAIGFTNNGNNSLTPTMAGVYNQLLAEMQTNAGGNASTFLVAGDLINGRWPDNSSALINNFGGGNIGGAIDNAADIYFGWHRELFRQHGFSDYLGAIGDHDIGDNDWSLGSSKANNVDNMKRAFGRTIVDPLGLPATWNGISSTAPAGAGEYDEGSYVKQVNNVLFVTVDVFRWEGGNPGSSLHPWFGAVSPEVTGTVGDSNSHLGWLDDVLTAADADATVDHVILQGHTPVLPGVRKQSSSGMMMQQRDDSPFWQVLRAHDHQNGGKVRMYYGGEVHTATATKDTGSDIVQLVHGNPPLGSGSTNYVVFEVDGKKIDAKLYQVDLQGGGGSYWQANGTNSGVGGMTPGVLTGTMTIDANGSDTTYGTSGFLDLVDYRGLIMHYSFDEDSTASQYENTGSLGDLYYNGNANGNPTTVPGKFGRAFSADGTGDFVKTAGGLAPISEGEQRTIGAWVNTSEPGTHAIFGYGQRKVANGEFNLQLDDGNLQLFIDDASGGKIATANNPAINDGGWHHVAVVLPGAHENQLGNVLFYVDGVEYSANTSDPSREIRTFAGSNSNIHVGANAENRTTGEHFDGLIDDVAMWGSPLTSPKLRGLYNAGILPSLEIDTLGMESLFDLFDEQTGTANVNGIVWNYATGLSGSGGDAFDLGNSQFAIVLDELGNGVLGAAQLILQVDRDTGAVSINRPIGTPFPVDGYTIGSDLGLLDPNDGSWNSLTDQSVPSWTEVNALPTRLSEFNVAGSTSIAQGSPLMLGNAYLPNPVAFGDPVEDLTFQYTTPNGDIVDGVVQYTGTNVNNLALIIDPTTGEATLKNASNFDVSIEAYTIASPSSSLDPNGWSSLSQQQVPGWIEVDVELDELIEFDVLGETLLLAGDSFSLGDLFAGSVVQDIQLSFLIAGESDLRDGVVLYQSLVTNLPGDFDEDGDVDGFDFLGWQRGESPNPFSTSDLNEWQNNYGASLAVAAHLVPEPSCLLLGALSASLYVLQETFRWGR